MALLKREDWFDLTRDVDWEFTHVDHEAVYPEWMSGSGKVPIEAWAKWKEPYVTSYPLLLSSLAEDAERLGRWSSELAKFCVAQRHENSEVLQRWVRRWEPRADAAAAGLATAIAALNGAPGTADDLLDAARAARRDRVEATLVPTPA